MRGAPLNPSVLPAGLSPSPFLAGQDAKDYDQVARKEHLKPVEVMLRMMEDPDLFKRPPQFFLFDLITNVFFF